MPALCAADQKRKTDKQNSNQNPQNSAAQQSGKQQSQTDPENQESKIIPTHGITPVSFYAGEGRM